MAFLGIVPGPLQTPVLPGRCLDCHWAAAGKWLRLGLGSRLDRSLTGRCRPGGSFARTGRLGRRLAKASSSWNQASKAQSPHPRADDWTTVGTCLWLGLGSWLDRSLIRRCRPRGGFARTGRLARRLAKLSSALNQNFEEPCPPIDRHLPSPMSFCANVPGDWGGQGPTTSQCTPGMGCQIFDVPPSPPPLPLPGDTEDEGP